MKPDVPLSEEQAAAFNSISNKKSASIDACAGSGKSHTTRAMARAYGGPVLTMPFSRALAEAEREAFKGRDNINSINFHAAGRRLSGDCEVDNSKLKRLANGDEKMEKAIELCTMLKNEAVGTFSDSLNPAEVAKKYGFNSDLINPAIQLLALSDADKKSVDFADMLRFPVLQGRTNLVSKNTLVLLDEVQDYTPASFEFLTKCIAPKGSLIATVGDKDRQALQQFCGATPKLFDSISDFYECEKMQITFNRRCAKKIVENAPFKGDMKALPDAPDGEISALSQSEVIEAALKGEYSKDAFIIFKTGNKFAATTRDDGSIGLPGGKLEKGETPFQAAVREATEEGWKVSGNLKIVRIATVDGKKIVWISCTKAIKLSNYKEKGRIKPILASGEKLAQNFGNQFLINYK